MKKHQPVLSKISFATGYDTEAAIIELLRICRSRLLQRGTWYKGGLWGTANGETAYNTEEATCACAMGHLALCEDGVVSSGALNFLRRALDTINPNIGIADYNDTCRRTKREIVALFDKAIELAESEGKI